MRITAIENVKIATNDGPNISGDGRKNIFVNYVIEYTLNDSVAQALCQSLEGTRLWGEAADIYYYEMQTAAIRAEIEREVRGKSLRELRSPEYKKEVQSRLDKINLEYLPDFKITLTNIGL
jgi:hypothetical protein